MSTPKTPMEMASKALGKYTAIHHDIKIPPWISNLSVGESYEKGIISDEIIGFLFGYLAGDADRERLMREEASRGFSIDLVKKCYREQGGNFDGILSDQLQKTMIGLSNRIYCAARADRAELVACVLEMAEAAGDLADIHGDACECRGHRAVKSDLKHYATLIAKLKAEKDTP